MGTGPDPQAIEAAAEATAGELDAEVPCRCIDAYKGRGLVDPQCSSHDLDPEAIATAAITAYLAAVPEPEAPSEPMDAFIGATCAGTVFPDPAPVPSPVRPEGLPDDAVPSPWTEGAWLARAGDLPRDWPCRNGVDDKECIQADQYTSEAIVECRPAPSVPATERVPLLKSDGTPNVVGRTLPGESEAIAFLQWSDGAYWKWDRSHGGGYRWRKLPVNDDGTVEVLSIHSDRGEGA